MNLSGIYVSGTLKAMYENERINQKTGLPYKSRSYAVNVEFNSDKRDTISIYLPRDQHHAELTVGAVYFFPVDPPQPNNNKVIYWNARADMAPFPAPRTN